MREAVANCRQCGHPCHAVADYEKRQRDLRSHRRTGLCSDCRDKAFDAGTPPPCTTVKESGSDEIVCPHCGYSYSPDIPENGERTCQVCDKCFDVEVEAIPLFTTRPNPKTIDHHKETDHP